MVISNILMINAPQNNNWYVKGNTAKSKNYHGDNFFSVHKN